MARIAGINIPLNKRTEIGLTYIYGIGQSTANQVLRTANVSPDTYVRDLTALGTLARAGVRLGVLTVHRKPAPMAQSAVGADLHQALDVLGTLAAQITLDRQLPVDDVAQARHLVIGEIPDVGVLVDVEIREQALRR